MMDCTDCGKELHEELAEMLKKMSPPPLCDQCLMDRVEHTEYNRPRNPEMVKKVARDA